MKNKQKSPWGGSLVMGGGGGAFKQMLTCDKGCVHGSKQQRHLLPHQPGGVSFIFSSARVSRGPAQLLQAAHLPESCTCVDGLTAGDTQDRRCSVENLQTAESS